MSKRLPASTVELVPVEIKQAPVKLQRRLFGDRAQRTRPLTADEQAWAQLEAAAVAVAPRAGTPWHPDVKRLVQYPDGRQVEQEPNHYAGQPPGGVNAALAGQSLGAPFDLTQDDTNALIEAELHRYVQVDEMDELTAMIGPARALRYPVNLQRHVLLVAQRGGIHEDPMVRLLAWRAWGDRDQLWIPELAHALELVQEVRIGPDTRDERWEELDFEERAKGRPQHKPGCPCHWCIQLPGVSALVGTFRVGADYQVHDEVGISVIATGDDVVIRPAQGDAFSGQHGQPGVVVGMAAARMQQEWRASADGPRSPGSQVYTIRAWIYTADERKDAQAHHLARVVNAKRIELARTAPGLLGESTIMAIPAAVDAVRASDLIAVDANGAARRATANDVATGNVIGIATEVTYEDGSARVTVRQLEPGALSKLASVGASDAATELAKNLIGGKQPNPKKAKT